MLNLDSNNFHFSRKMLESCVRVRVGEETNNSASALTEDTSQQFFPHEYSEVFSAIKYSQTKH